MNLQDIGFFLYMQEQEEKKKHDTLEVNVNINDDFVAEQTTTNKEDD